MPPRFAWSRHRAGNWTAHGYEIVRRVSRGWRILRDGETWGVVETLPNAKRACERDLMRRKGGAGDGR